MAYLKQNLIALDQLVNTILGGHADETMSSRAFRTELSGKIIGRVMRPLIDLVFFFDKEHCYKSYLSEVYRRQLPIHFKDVTK